MNNEGFAQYDYDKIFADFESLISTERQRVLDEMRGLVEVMRGEYQGGEADGPQRRNWSRQGYRQACYDLLSALKEMGDL